LKLALNDEQIDIFNFITLVARSGGYDTWVLSTSCKKSNIGLPQQPPTERVSEISKRWIFNLFHKKGPALVIFVPGMIQPSGSGSLRKYGCKGC
jgi:hypothetical protein